MYTIENSPIITTQAYNKSERGYEKNGGKSRSCGKGEILGILKEYEYIFLIKLHYEPPSKCMMDRKIEVVARNGGALVCSLPSTVHLSFDDRA